MPRPALTPANRSVKVAQALVDLPNLFAHAALLPHGTPEAHAAWAKVEEVGAIVHRQYRILAGKSRGG